MSVHRLFILLVLQVVLHACAAPATFVRTSEPTWATVELRSDAAFERAWSSVVDTLVKRFDMEVLSKDDGYARTNWLYSWTGKVLEDYRVRVTVKFSQDRSKCEIKSEAEYYDTGGWEMGYDTRLLETIKTDVMGTIGRTTR